MKFLLALSTILALPYAHANPLQVAIFPCGKAYDCVSVDGRRYQMTTRTERIADVEILARSPDHALVRLTAVEDRPTLVYFRTAPPAQAEFFGFADDGQRHATKDQLGELVRDPALLAYLRAPADHEGYAMDIVLGKVEDLWTGIDYLRTLRTDVDRLESERMMDSHVLGKFNRLKDVGFRYFFSLNPIWSHRLLMLTHRILPSTKSEPLRATEWSNQVLRLESRIADALGELH